MIVPREIRKFELRQIGVVIQVVRQCINKESLLIHLYRLSP